MYKKLGDVQLRDGEWVEAGVVCGPDAEWAPRIKPLLQHKGDPWLWQISQLLERSLAVESYFYILHRDGVPFANILTVETQGVGPFGHVYTVAADRRKGASSSLMELQMAHFRARGGRALFLGTGYDSVAFKMYERFGFSGIEPESGFMDYYVESQSIFNEAFFAPGPAAVEPLAWSHWPSMQPLFMGNWPGIVRWAACGANGRTLVEEEPLPLIEANEINTKRGHPLRAWVLRNEQTSAIVGFASRLPHPMWSGLEVVDVHCHPRHWASATLLLEKLREASQGHLISYSDPANEQRTSVLEACGFQVSASFTGWLPRSKRHDASSQLLVLDGTVTI